MNRKNISSETETKALIYSNRRCAFCFGLENDFRIKKGQIAHIDKNNQNSKLENLVFLCMVHHDEYDSTTSQSKGLRSKELIQYRTALYEFVENHKLSNKVRPNSPDFLINKSRNQFHVYELVNSNSLCGYPFLMINETKDLIIFISDGHFSMDSPNYEEIQWINTDYIKTGKTFKLDITRIFQYIFDVFHENDFSSVVYFNKESNYDGMVFAFGIGIENYYEISYSVNDNKMSKKSKNGYSDFERIIDLNTLNDYDLITYNELKDCFKDILDKSINLLK